MPRTCAGTWPILVAREDAMPHNMPTTDVPEGSQNQPRKPMPHRRFAALFVRSLQILCEANASAYAAPFHANRQPSQSRAGGDDCRDPSW